MKCHICNSRNLKFLFKSRNPDNISQKYYSLYQCSHCNTVSIQPIPSIEELKKFYNIEYYSYNYYGIVNRFLLKLRSNKITNKGAILDIGCGEGSFLKLMKEKGFICCGLETSAPAVKEARQKGLVVYSNIKNIKKKIDFITLWQVFEHITTPVSYLMSIKNLLKKNGCLIISIPNFNSLQSRMGEKYWFHLDLPRHVLHYTPETITSLLKKENFKIIKIEHFSWEYGPFGFLQTILNLFRIKTNLLYKIIRRKSFKIDISIAALLIVPILIPISILLSVFEAILKRGGSILVYAKKRN